MIDLDKNITNFNDGIDKWAESIVDDILHVNLNIIQLASCLINYAESKPKESWGRYIKICIKLAEEVDKRGYPQLKRRFLAHMRSSFKERRKVRDDN